ncbi:hypothetical protein SAMN03159463_05473 [Mesorhizobium sp. NFR06]|uniref:hypothetical protein n=1 Tax=Mesorhizobium sp. NFR06 TaxID=1566290 RepID=UPI0008ED8E42|nr:hypothetical protein [Mesorhizobium sp. NFR06]SFQ04589.1 hypothetical protein SAMN03159463_05473 [Mesorhizobium sp. NFR06]
MFKQYMETMAGFALITVFLAIVVALWNYHPLAAGALVAALLVGGMIFERRYERRWQAKHGRDRP